MSRVESPDAPSTAVEIHHDLDRVEGITTEQRVHRRPARHGGAAKFVLADRDRDVEPLLESWDVGEGRTIPDGSLYQHARAAWYAHEDELVEDHRGRKYAVLSRTYEHPDEDEDDEYAVTLRSSRWMAGTGENENYRAWYKYDVTLQPLDEDGEIDWWRTPPRALSVKIIPQADELVYPDGNDLELPHGEGSLVEVQSTWIQEPEEFLERAAHLLGSTLGYGVRSAEIVEDSKGFRKAEVHHRINKGTEDDLVHTLRQSVDLLARHEAEVQDRNEFDGHRWLEAKIRTDQWERLGFGDLDAPVLAKVYYPEAPDQVEYPMDQPKFEVALDGKETVVDDGRTTERWIHWDRWEEIVAHLEEILLAHLQWAAISPEDLVADDYSAGPNAQRVAFQLPEGRRTWLRKHYESLVPALYREATKHNTDLIYDILNVVHKHGPCTYEKLVEETGAAYRTVREHVRRLEEDVGGDGPGLLKRIPDAVTFVTFSSRYFEELGEDALDTIKPDDTPEQREERAEERRSRREDNSSSDEEDRDQETSDGERNEWRYLSDLPIDGDQLAAALDRGHIQDDHVRVRVDPHAWLRKPGG